MSGARDAYRRSLLARAGVGVDRPSTGRHPIEVLAATPPDAELRARVAEAVQILQSFANNDEARQEAFKALTGTELLVQFGEASCARS